MLYSKLYTKISTARRMMNGTNEFEWDRGAYYNSRFNQIWKRFDLSDSTLQMNQHGQNIFSNKSTPLILYYLLLSIGVMSMDNKLPLLMAM